MSALRLLLLATGLVCLLGCPRPLPTPSTTSQLVNVSPASDPSVNLAKLPSSLVYVRAFCKRSASQPDVMGTAFVVGHTDGWSYLISARHVLFPRECGPTPHPLAQRVELRGEGVLPFDGDPSELIEKPTDSQGDLLLFHAQGKKDTPTARLSVLVPEMLGSGAEPMDALGFTTLQARSTQPQSERSRGLLSTNNREGRLVLTTEAKLYPSMSGGPVALRSSGLVVGVVLGEYEAQKGASREGRIASLTPLIDLLPEALRQQLGIVLHYSVSAAYQPIPPQPTWVERPEQAKVLSVLDEAPKGQAPARVLLHGIGGVGKTTLAYQVAALRQSRFPGGTVKVELNNRTTDLVLSDLIEALTGHRPQPGDWFKQVRALLANRSPMLVILDNVRLDEAPWNQPEVMESLLQALMPATLVMTSRSRQAPPGFAPILLVSLPDKDATELAGKLAKQKGVALEPRQAALLGRLLGGLPFAIERAVELMHSENHSAQSLLAKLQAEGRDPEGRLAKLLDWSYDALDADAKAALVAMGQLAEAPVPEVLLAGLLPQTNRAQGIQRLLRSGLIDRVSPGATTYHQHTLLWEWANKLGTERHQAAVAAIQQRMVESLKTHDEQVAPLLITHLLTAQRLAEERQQWERVLGLMAGTERALGTFGYWGAEKELLERALRAAHKGKDRRAIAKILRSLGVVANSQGDHAAARKYNEQSLEIARALGDSHGIVGSLGNLGTVAQRQGDYEHARTLYQQSLDLAQSLKDRRLIAGGLGNLGVVVQLQGDYEAARNYYQRSLDLAQSLEDRELIASSLLNLGEVARLQGDYETACNYYQQSLNLAQSLGDRDAIAGNLLNLGLVAQSRGDYAAARTYHQQSLELAQALEDRNKVALNLLNLGVVARQLDDNRGARNLYEQSLKLAQAMGDRKLISSNLSNLGSLAGSEEDYEAALSYYQQALDIAKVLGNREVLATILAGLGELAQSQRAYDSALKYYQQSLDIAKALGDRKVVATVLHNLGSLAESQGNHEAALSYYQQALDIAKVLGNREVLATILVGLGELAQSQRAYDSALKYYQQSLDTAKALGDRKVVATVLSSLGSLAESQEDHEAARRYYQQSLDLAQVLGDRKFTAGNLGNLGNLARSQGDYEAARKYYQQSLDIAQSFNDRQIIATILNNLGEVARLRGHYQTARHYYQQSLDLAQARSDRKLIAAILCNMGLVAQSQGDYKAASKYYQQSLALAQSLGEHQIIGRVASNLGVVRQSQGDYEAARKYYQQSLVLAQSLGDQKSIAGSLLNLGEVARLELDHEAALKFYRQSLALAQALGDRQVIAILLLNLGLVAQSQGDYGAAHKYYRQSLDLAQQLGDREVMAIILLNLGTLAEKDGSVDVDAAEKYFGEARQMAASLSASNWILGKALWGLGRVAAKRGKKAEARQYVDQAIQILQQLGDPAFQAAQQFRDSLGSAPDPVRCRKTCDELQAKGELAVPMAECVQKLCAD